MYGQIAVFLIIFAYQVFYMVFCDFKFNNILFTHDMSHLSFLDIKLLCTRIIMILTYDHFNYKQIITDAVQYRVIVDWLAAQRYWNCKYPQFSRVLFSCYHFLLFPSLIMHFTYSLYDVF